jgi:hypothetical protein
MANEVEIKPGFFQRLGLAFKVLGDATLAGRVMKLSEPVAPAKAVALPPEKVHASGLYVLGTLQQEGRLIDFLQQDVAAFSDEEVGSAARVVHGGCRKALERIARFEPVLREGEGDRVTVPTGFDAEKIRLTGNVTGQPPYNGTLKHHGWVANELRFPTLNDTVDYRVIAPAEVEL